MHPIFSSSANPQELSMTLKGILVSMVPIVMEFLQVINVNLSETILMEWIQAITVTVALMLMTVGSVRKLYHVIKDHFTTPESTEEVVTVEDSEV